MRIQRNIRLLLSQSPQSTLSGQHVSRKRLQISVRQSQWPACDAVYYIGNGRDLISFHKVS